MRLFLPFSLLSGLIHETILDVNDQISNLKVLFEYKNVLQRNITEDSTKLETTLQIRSDHVQIT